MMHTPGPWVVRADHPTQDILYIVPVEKNDRGWRPEIAWVEQKRNNDNSEADARLLASAPSLLHALDELLKDYLRVTSNGLTNGASTPHIFMARQVLSEARGEQ